MINYKESLNMLFSEAKNENYNVHFYLYEKVIIDKIVYIGKDYVRTANHEYVPFTAINYFEIRGRGNEHIAVLEKKLKETDAKMEMMVADFEGFDPEDKDYLEEAMNELFGTSAAVLVFGGMMEDPIDVSCLAKTLKEPAEPVEFIILDGMITRGLVEDAVKCGVKAIVGLRCRTGLGRDHNIKLFTKRSRYAKFEEVR